MASVAALRVGGLIESDCASVMTDSALEAYEAFLRKADLESALPLASLPPSFKRALSHLDAAVACRDAPNARPLLLAEVCAPSIDDVSLRVDVATAFPKTQRRRDGLFLRRRDGARSSNTLLAADVGAALFEDFAVTLVADAASEPVLRFASNTAFLGPGRVSLPKAALDVFPKWRDKLPASYSVVFLIEDAAFLAQDQDANGDEVKKTDVLWVGGTDTKVLVPHDRKAILELGLNVLASSSSRTPQRRRSSPGPPSQRRTPPQQRQPFINTTPTFVQPPF